MKCNILLMDCTGMTFFWTFIAALIASTRALTTTTTTTAIVLAFASGILHRALLRGTFLAILSWFDRITQSRCSHCSLIGQGQILLNGITACHPFAFVTAIIAFASWTLCTATFAVAICSWFAWFAWFTNFTWLARFTGFIARAFCA